MPLVSLSLGQTVVYPVSTHVLAPWPAGLIPAALLTGILCHHQFGFVFSSRELVFNRAVGVVLLTMTAVSFAAQVAIAWTAFIVQFGQPIALLKVATPLLTVETVTFSIVVLASQAFYARRAVILYSSSKRLACVLGFAIVFCFVASLVAAAEFEILDLYTGPDYLPLVRHLAKSVAVAFLSAAITDVALTLLLVVKLLRSRTVTKTMHDAIRQILIMTLTTGALTSCGAILLVGLVLANNAATGYGMTCVCDPREALTREGSL